jgi:hypothetical protein
MPPKSQNAPSAPKIRKRSENVLVTKNVQAQLKAVANEAAVPLILAEINHKNIINTLVENIESLLVLKEEVIKCQVKV